jgi:hypothetical protein
MMAVKHNTNTNKGLFGGEIILSTFLSHVISTIVSGTASYFHHSTLCCILDKIPAIKAANAVATDSDNIMQIGVYMMKIIEVIKKQEFSLHLTEDDLIRIRNTTFTHALSKLVDLMTGIDVIQFIVDLYNNNREFKKFITIINNEEIPEIMMIDIDKTKFIGFVRYNEIHNGFLDELNAVIQHTLLHIHGLSSSMKRQPGWFDNYTHEEVVQYENYVKFYKNLILKKLGDYNSLTTQYIDKKPEVFIDIIKNDFDKVIEKAILMQDIRENHIEKIEGEVSIIRERRQPTNRTTRKSRKSRSTSRSVSRSVSRRNARSRTTNENTTRNRRSKSAPGKKNKLSTRKNISSK